MKLKIGVALLAFVTAVIPLSLSAEGGLAQAIASRDAARTYANLPLRFEPAVEQGHFLARSSGYAVLVGPRESAIAVTAKSGSTQTLRFRFDGSNAAARIEAIEPLPGITNYYIGSDSEQLAAGRAELRQAAHQGRVPRRGRGLLRRQPPPGIRFRGRPHGRPHVPLPWRSPGWTSSISMPRASS